LGVVTQQILQLALS